MADPKSMASLKKIENLTALFSELREKSVKAGEKVENIRWEFLREVYTVPTNNNKRAGNSYNWNKLLWFLILPIFGGMLTLTIMETDLSGRCLLDTNDGVLNEITRKPSECSHLCEGLHEVPRISDLSREEFLSTYAYSGRPVVITDAAKNWSAVGKFSFKFFKRLYTKHLAATEENVEEGCMFFPYNSGFNSLAEALRMPKRRAEWKAGEPWYIGWSNCDPTVRRKLRKHYNTPYFLPPDSETSDQDWIFMGGPGPGAPLHIDKVGRPSWQAQLSGQKMWTLIPPIECDHVCRAMNVTVQKGDIIVLDTDQWFHKTKIVPTGELSITIGAEYD